MTVVKLLIVWVSLAVVLASPACAGEGEIEVGDPRSEVV